MSITGAGAASCDKTEGAVANKTINEKWGIRKGNFMGEDRL